MYRSKNRFGGKANTVAVLVDCASDPYQETLLRGAHDAAQVMGANLLCFIGGRIPRDAGRAGRHSVFDLVGPQNSDAVVALASPLSHEVGSDGLAHYCRKFGSLPLCSVGVDLGPGSITVANEAGMHTLVLHLVDEHRARRIAFVRGPKYNTEAALRERAFRSALERRGIALDERLLVTGDFSTEGGRNAMGELELRGIELAQLDAVVAANDSMAIGVLHALSERAIAVPADVRVVGFDDIEDAHLTYPALTTVRQPMERQGAEAIRLALDAVRQRQLPPAEALPTELIVRQSCGCGEVQPAPPSLVPELSCGFESAFILRRQRIIDSLSRSAHGSFGAAGPDWQERLLNALLEDLRELDGIGFVRALQELMDCLLNRNVDPSHCDQMLDTLRAQILPLLRMDPPRRTRAEDLFHFARQAIGRTLQRVMMRAHLNLNRWVRNVSLVCTSLATARDLTELRLRLRRQLAQLGVKSAFVVLYDAGVAPHDARLLTGFDCTTDTEWSDSGAFQREALLPPSLVHAADQGRSYAVLPLSADQRALGHVLLELDPSHGCAYGPLGEALSGAVRVGQLTESWRNSTELAIGA